MIDRDESKSQHRTKRDEVFWNVTGASPGLLENSRTNDASIHRIASIIISIGLDGTLVESSD